LSFGDLRLADWMAAKSLIIAEPDLLAFRRLYQVAALIKMG
jgi:hypothetical protein